MQLWAFGAPEMLSNQFTVLLIVWMLLFARQLSIEHLSLEPLHHFASSLDHRRSAFFIECLLNHLHRLLSIAQLDEICCALHTPTPPA
jgi:hypothetical protein